MTLHILHLEDEPSLREAIQIALTELDPNIHLLQFDAIDSALAYIKEHINQINLYVLDILISGNNDGFAVAKTINQLHGTGSIVFTSAFEPPQRYTLKTLKAQYVRKPYGIESTAKLLLETAKTAWGEMQSGGEFQYL